MKLHVDIKLCLCNVFQICTKPDQYLLSVGWNLSHLRSISVCLTLSFCFQGVLVFLAAKSGFIKDAEEAAQFQDFIICVEMLIAAVGHLYAFPYKEYAGANIGGSRGLTGSLAHALKLNDFYHDTVHQVSVACVTYCIDPCY